MCHNVIVCKRHNERSRPGTVSYSAVVIRQLARSVGGLHRSGDAADLRPDLESLRPCGSALGDSDVILAELEEVVDLIVG
jgi:hypothetical protein